MTEEKSNLPSIQENTSSSDAAPKPTEAAGESSQAEPETLETPSEADAAVSEAADKPKEPDEAPTESVEIKVHSAVQPDASQFQGGEPSPVILKQRKVWPLWVAILLLAVIMSAGGFYAWQYLQVWKAEINLALDRSQEESQLADNLRRQFDPRLLQLEQGWKSQSNVVQRLEDQLNQTARRILTQSATGRTDWLLAEAEYLLRLGNQRLRMEKDYLGALAIMEAADSVLSETKEVAVFPVRKALQSEIIQLSSVADVDRQGIYLRLEALIDQIENLDQSLFFKETVQAVDEENEVEETKEITWRERAKKTLKEVEKYFVIRNLDEPVAPLLAPEQIYYLRQNLRLMLEQSELALLDKNQELYERSLSKAESWISTYFISNDPSTEAMLSNIQTLKQKPIDPKLPDISESLRLLKGLMDSIYKRSGSTQSSSIERFEDGGQV